MKSTTSDIILLAYIEVNDIKTKWQSEVKLLEIWIDNELKFSKHILNRYSKATVQLKIIYRFINRKVLKQEDKTEMYRAFMVANFNYCPIVWHYCGASMM